MQHELIIDGNRFSDCDGFVEEFNRAYLALLGGMPWEGNFHRFAEFLEAVLGNSGAPLTIRWLNSRKSSVDLGHEQMAEYCLRHKLDQARVGQGRTLFEWLVWQVHGDGNDRADVDDLVELKLE